MYVKLKVPTTGLLAWSLAVAVAGCRLPSAVNVPPNTSTRAQAACPAGKKVIGGAGNVQTIPAASPVHTSLTGDDHFNVDFVNTSNVTRQLNAIAICATVAP